MDWIQKMTEAMTAMKEACQSNEDWNKCAKCPFDIYCTSLMTDNLIDPFEGITWE